MFDVEKMKISRSKPEEGPGYILTEHRFPEPLKPCNAFAIDAKFDYGKNSVYRIPYPVIYRNGEWFNEKLIERNKSLTVQIVGWNYRAKDL